jgi:hypothetical protein
MAALGLQQYVGANPVTLHAADTAPRAPRPRDLPWAAAVAQRGVAGPGVAHAPVDAAAQLERHGDDARSSGSVELRLNPLVRAAPARVLVDDSDGRDGSRAHASEHRGSGGGGSVDRAAGHAAAADDARSQGHAVVIVPAPIEVSVDDLLAQLHAARDDCRRELHHLSHLPPAFDVDVLRGGYAVDGRRAFAAVDAVTAALTGLVVQLRKSPVEDRVLHVFSSVVELAFLELCVSQTLKQCLATLQNREPASVSAAGLNGGDAGGGGGSAAAAGPAASPMSLPQLDSSNPYAFMARMLTIVPDRAAAGPDSALDEDLMALDEADLLRASSEGYLVHNAEVSGDSLAVCAVARCVTMWVGRCVCCSATSQGLGALHQRPCRPTAHVVCARPPSAGGCVRAMLGGGLS